MSKYSLLGVCQPQRGGLSYFCGCRCYQRAVPTRGHSDRDCRSGDRLSRPIGHLRTIDPSITDPLWSSPLPSLPPQSDIRPSFLLPENLSPAVTLSDSELSGRLCQCRDPRGLHDSKGNRRERMRKSGGKDGRRGIAGFGRLDSRAGFTVSRETRTPRLD